MSRETRSTPAETAPPDPAAETPREKKLEKIRRRWSRRRVGAAGFVGLLAAILAVGLVVRFGVLTDPGRAAVTRLLEGQNVGRFGRLHVEGLTGDVFHEFSVRRLSLVDARGAWMEARDLTLRWTPLDLIRRRFHAQSLRADVLRVLRRPELTPDTGGPTGPSPVSVAVDDLKLRLETLPAFSVREGLWDVTGEAEIGRRGTAKGRLDAQSRTHAGDGVAALFDFGRKGRMLIRIDAVEGAGGALAGALGLPAHERFLVHARAQGTAESAGALSVAAESGARRPLVANGRWSRAGANLDAVVQLEASTLARGYAAKVGPELHVTLSSRNAGGDRFLVAGAARARDATFTVKGPVDWKRRNTTGLAVDLSVAKLISWVEAVNAGPSRAVGVLSGDLARWRFQGRVQVDRLDQWGYRLARAAGPASFAFDPRDIRVQADLATAGGSGEGLLPALLGASPHFKLDGSRLAGGRILIREAAVDGPGLSLHARGDRSLLGALSLTGDVAVTRLERAHPGAKGAVKASWTARQSGKSPWSLAAEAKGEGFATGYAEADHLLGAAPKLSVQASWGDGLSISRADLNGEALQASVRGAIDPKSVLALDVDWRARGPFEAGPVEIAGQAMGTGKISGRAAAPEVELNAELAAIDFGPVAVTPARLELQFATEGGLNGRIALTGDSQWGKAAGKARFRFLDDGLELSEIAADAGGLKASGAVALRDGAPSSADLTVALGPGAFLAQGKLAGSVKILDRPGGATAQVALDGAQVAPPGRGLVLKTVRLRADGPFARLPFQLALDADQPTAWRFAGDGLLTQTGSGAGLVREIALNGAGRVRQADIRTLEPARIRFAASETGMRLRLGVGAGRADLDARLAGEAVEAKADVSGVELASLVNAYTGKLSGDLALTGRGDRLTGTADAAIEGGRDRDAPANVALSAKLHAALADSHVRIEATGSNPQGLTAKLDADLPTEASAAPFRVAVIRNKPISGSLDAQGELRPLWDLVAGGARTLSGRGAIQASLGGTLNEMRPTGQASLDGGRFHDIGTGLDLRNLTVQASFDRMAIDMRRFTADDGHAGQLSGSGELSVAPNGLSTFRLDLKGFRLIDNDLARASASGRVTMTRDASGKARLAGALSVDRADITAKPPVPNGVTPMEVVEIHRPAGDEEADAARRGLGGPEIALDVALRAPRGVFVKGNGLDAELSLDAHVGGTSAAPELTGTARIVRGDYAFAGTRFEFDETGTIRLASRPEAIRIDLTATRDNPALKAIVHIGGTAAKPEISLTSMPVLPQDEVLSQVLFGRSASQLSPLEAAQLASAVAALATGGGLDVLGGLRQFARLDRLSFAGGGAGSAATVSGGKYLTEDVYLELTGGGRTGPSAQVEWRIRRNLSVVSTVGGQSDTRLSVRFRRNY